MAQTKPQSSLGTAVIATPELFVRSVLGFASDSDDVGRLPLATSVKNQIGTATMAVVPGGLDEDTTAVCVTGFSNGPASFALTRGPF